MIAGVCGGIAQYFAIDPTLVRLAFVAFTLAGGAGVLLYAALAIIIPLEPVTMEQPQPMPSAQQPEWPEAAEEEARREVQETSVASSGTYRR